jgi:GNAT superfamily N-acetyltransferase
MNIGIRTLEQNEIDQAVDCFARAIERDWPNNQNEAKNWIYDEFHHINSIIFGAFLGKELVGVCSLVPFDFVLAKLDKKEGTLIPKFLKDKFGIDKEKIIYLGGFGVKEKFENMGVATKLFTFTEKTAINNGYRMLVGHTARPSQKYGKIKGLGFALSMKMEELPLVEKFFLSLPNDLEKVWLYKII